jgi:hypothetical protein
MSIELSKGSICEPSENVIAREIEDEILIIPIVGGMVEGDDAIYTLNSTAQAIWNLLDGKNTLEEVVKILSESIPSEEDVIEKDVFGFVEEMINLSILKLTK